MLKKRHQATLVRCIDGDNWQIPYTTALSRTMAWQRSRLLFVELGDANTKLFHLQECHRSRKNCIRSFNCWRSRCCRLRANGRGSVRTLQPVCLERRHHVQLLFGSITLVGRPWSSWALMFASRKKRFGQLCVTPQMRRSHGPKDSRGSSTNGPGKSLRS